MNVKSVAHQIKDSEETDGKYLLAGVEKKHFQL